MSVELNMTGIKKDNHGERPGSIKVGTMTLIRRQDLWKGTSYDTGRGESY